MGYRVSTFLGKELPTLLAICLFCGCFIVWLLLVIEIWYGSDFSVPEFFYLLLYPVCPVKTRIRLPILQSKQSVLLNASVIRIIHCIELHIISFLYILSFQARTFCFSLGFTVAFGALFSKTWRVYKIFTNKKLLKLVGYPWFFVQSGT